MAATVSEACRELVGAMAQLNYREKTFAYRPTLPIKICLVLLLVEICDPPDCFVHSH
jgi:hypothetical protein